jgi:hypothetical protein
MQWCSEERTILSQSPPPHLPLPLPLPPILQNCSPQGHRSRFVDIGFQDPDILREVADKWTFEEQRELMKLIAPRLNGKNITELELQLSFILLIHTGHN